jgi:hypothetical protein
LIPNSNGYCSSDKLDGAEFTVEHYGKDSGIFSFSYKIDVGSKVHKCKAILNEGTELVNGNFVQCFKGQDDVGYKYRLERFVSERGGVILHGTFVHEKDNESGWIAVQVE